MASTSCRIIHLRSQWIFASRDSPVRSSPSVMTGVTGIAGRSAHSGESISGTETMRTAPPNAAFRPATAATVWHSPSTAMTGSSKPREASHCGIGTCSGTRILCSSMPVPASCFTAWMKYRVSVQRPAWSRVMHKSPASPVKPDTHSTCFQRRAGYSLAWGSLPVRMTASQPFPRIRSRMASTRNIDIFADI